MTKPSKVSQRQAALRSWLRDEGGLSSYSIVWALCPELRDFADGCAGSFGLGFTPADPIDFRRCRDVLEMIPGGASRIFDVAAAFPDTAWPAFAAAWSELDSLYEEESKNSSVMAPRLYARIRALREPAKGAR